MRADEDAEEPLAVERQLLVRLDDGSVRNDLLAFSRALSAALAVRGRRSSLLTTWRSFCRWLTDAVCGLPIGGRRSPPGPEAIELTRMLGMASRSEGVDQTDDQSKLRRTGV